MPGVWVRAHSGAQAALPVRCPEGGRERGNQHSALGPLGHSSDPSPQVDEILGDQPTPKEQVFSRSPRFSGGATGGRAGVGAHPGAAPEAAGPSWRTSGTHSGSGWAGRGVCSLPPPQVLLLCGQPLSWTPNTCAPKKLGFVSVTPKADPGKGSYWCCHCQGVTLSERRAANCWAGTGCRRSTSCCPALSQAQTTEASNVITKMPLALHERE